MVSIGYGDISPQNVPERNLGILCMLMTSVTFGIVLGNIGSIITKRGAIEDNYRQTILNLNNYIKQNKVEKELSRKVRMFVEYKLNVSKDEEFDLYDLLSR